MPSGGVENLAARRGSSHPRGSTGLGHDIRAGLMDPRETQLRALRRIVCHLLIRHNGVDRLRSRLDRPDRQRPVGDTGRHEPLQVDAIIDAELHRALEDPDPLRGIAQLTARLKRAAIMPERVGPVAL
jgi:hypothetical protein